MTTPGPLHYAKGHGTENDFIVLSDPNGLLDLDEGLVRALCDRRAGLGADGVLRVVASAHVADGGPDSHLAHWFMDYRNADGSRAEMCGNGIRVYARYLVHAGLARPGELRLATRAGVRTVLVEPGGDVTVDMGPAEVQGRASAQIGGLPYTGTRVSMGNPHLVVLLSDLDGSVDGVDLHRPPEVDPAEFPDGVNVEVVERVGDGHIRMRVHERGVGETRSCGTGACAAAVAAVHQSAVDAGEVVVDLPGGRLVVRVDEDRVLLRGPAVLVGEGNLRPEWLAAVRRTPAAG